MLEDMGRPSAFFQALEKSTAFTHTAAMFDQAGQKGLQTLVEAWEGVRRAVFESANVDPSLHDGAVCPNVGPTQMRHP